MNFSVISSWNPGPELNQNLIERFELTGSFDGSFNPTGNITDAVALGRAVFGENRTWIIKMEGDKKIQKNISCIAYPLHGDWQATIRGIGSTIEEAICRALVNIQE